MDERTAAELAAYGELAGVVERVLPVDHEADALAAAYERSRGKPQLRPLTRRCDVTEVQTAAPPELEWKAVKNTGTCDAPEMVVAEVAGGRLFAGTVWDYDGDGGAQGGWRILFVPDPRA